MEKHTETMIDIKIQLEYTWKKKVETFSDKTEDFHHMYDKLKDY